MSTTITLNLGDIIDELVSKKVAALSAEVSALSELVAELEETVDALATKRLESASIPLPTPRQKALPAVPVQPRTTSLVPLPTPAPTPVPPPPPPAEDEDEDEDEIWKQVPGHDGAYEVSSKGRVRRVAGGHGAVAGRILKPTGNPPFVRLCVNGVTRVYPVARIVATVFLRQPVRGEHAFHKDGDPLNNDASNLYWGPAGSKSGGRKGGKKGGGKRCRVETPRIGFELVNQ